MGEGDRRRRVAPPSLMSIGNPELYRRGVCTTVPLTAARLPAGIRGAQIKLVGHRMN